MYDEAEHCDQKLGITDFLSLCEKNYLLLQRVQQLANLSEVGDKEAFGLGLSALVNEIVLVELVSTGRHTHYFDLSLINCMNSIGVGTGFRVGVYEDANLAEVIGMYQVRPCKREGRLVMEKQDIAMDKQQSSMILKRFLTRFLCEGRSLTPCHAHIPT